ncbi:MAG: hypothetical protein KKC99_12015 [Proteobacteria bacterium]|nr:hypothetical protein [Pseudomonadota bacterium]
MKYILFKDFSGNSVPVIFPGRVKFDEMREQIPYSEAVSAGFVRLVDGHVVCHGEARELGMTVRAQDAEIITSNLSQDD